MWTEGDAEDCAIKLIHNHGWVEASRIAETEAKPHFLWGNEDDFWAAVLDVINSYGK